MINKNEAKEKIKRIIDSYQKIVSENRLSEYNESRTVKDFILPLFEALGWDIHNRENEDEVLPEEKVSRKRVDFSFRLNGIPKFFLEAKKLREDIEDSAYVKQAINYSWHKDVVLAVLTNFSNLHIYNCEYISENPLSQNRILSLNFKDYLNRFDDLWLLSKESFATNLMEDYLRVHGKKLPRKKPVGEQLLDSLMDSRKKLSANIPQLNKGMKLSQEDVEEAVQKIIDRLIFIRNCEDKDYEQHLLRETIREFKEHPKKGKYLLEDIFRYFDNEYDSDLFKPWICDQVKIDNFLVSEVIESLYTTKDKSIKYDFSAIDADVLGNIYEQYLGHILKVTPTKRTKISNGKAHRKEQGIYYTPTYIVDYIVKNTLGELLKSKSPEEVKKIKILDPACGSGSFLIKAYDIIEEYYRKNMKVDELPAKLKKDILINNIYGVDLDPKAVEIARLNLLLKAAQRKTTLPQLENNIKCGNSLIDDETISERAFKWEEEFREIMKDGGFDVVVGNPPYVRIHEFDDLTKRAFKKFSSATGQYDIYVLFIEQGLKLLRDGGILGFIVSNKFLISDYGIGLRKIILEHSLIKKIVDVSNIRVFKDASVYPVIILLQKTEQKKLLSKNVIEVINNVVEEKELFQAKISKHSQSKLLTNENYIIDVTSLNKELIDKIEKDTIKLGDVSKIGRGFRPPKSTLIYKENKVGLNKYLIGKDIAYAYRIEWSGNYVRYDEKQIAEAKPITIFTRPKILIRDIGKRFNACYDTGEYLCLKTIYFIYDVERIDIKSLLGIINSKLMLFYFISKFSLMHIQGGYLRFRKQFLELLPIKQINDEQSRKLCSLVDKIIMLNSTYSKIKDKQTDEKVRLEKEIQKLDNEIDEEVYKLYGISEEEKKIIEGSLK